MGGTLSSQLSDEEISVVNEETGCKLFYLFLVVTCQLVSHLSVAGVIMSPEFTVNSSSKQNLPNPDTVPKP